MAAEVEDWKEALYRILQGRVYSKEETSIDDLVEDLNVEGHQKNKSQVQNFLSASKDKNCTRQSHREV